MPRIELKLASPAFSNPSEYRIINAVQTFNCPSKRKNKPVPLWTSRGECDTGKTNPS